MSGRELPVVHLVACTKRKRAEPCPARELYAASDWFAKARAYVEPEAGRWFVLSALHGLLAPEQVVAPYEFTLIGQPWPVRRRWADGVRAQLAERGLFRGSARFVFLAGAQYREHLVEELGGAELCGAPLARLGLGAQKAWLAEQARRLTNV